MDLINLLNHQFSQIAAFAYLIFILYLYFFSKKYSTKTVFLVSAIFFLVVRFFDFEYWWSNPDLAQWIICAKSLVDTPSDWIFSFSLFDFTRTFSILPFVVLYLFKGSVSYFDAHVLFQITILCFILIQLVLLRKLFHKNTVMIALAFFLVFFTLSNHYDYRIYNSEIPAILFYSFSTLIFLRALENNKGWFFVGFILSLMPFAKEQSIFIALTSFFYIFIFLIIFKRYRDLYKLILGGFLGGGALFIVVLSLHGMDNLLWLFTIESDYHEVGLGVAAAGAYQKLIVFLSSSWLNKEMILILPLAIFGLLIGLNPFRKKIWDTKEIMKGFVGAGFLAALYSVYAPGNKFLHYNLLLWPGLIFFICVAFQFFQQWNQRSILAIFTLVFLIMINYIRIGNTRPWRAQESFQKKMEEWQNDPFVHALMEHGISNTDVVLWGWDTTTPVMLNLNRVTPFLYPQFAYGAYQNAKLVKANYLNILQQKKPKYFIELVGLGRRYFNDTHAFSIRETFEEMQKELDEHYQLLFRRK